MSTDSQSSSPEQEVNPEVVVKASTTIYVQLLSYGVSQLQRHGLVFVMMFLGLMWFYKQFVHLTMEVKECNDAKMLIYEKNQERMEGVINRNTLSWEQLRQTIKINNYTSDYQSQ